MSERKKIYDLFYGDIVFHVKGMIQAINSAFSDHHFIVYLTDKELVEDYRSFFADLGISDHTLIYLGETPFHTLGGSRKTLRQRLACKWQAFKLFCALFKFRREALIVHGFFQGVFRFLAAFAFRNLSYVCWVAAWKPGFKGRLRLASYFGVREMIFLQDSDLQRYREISGKKTGRCIPYLSAPAQQDLRPQQRHMILLGNSGARWQEYIEVLRLLEHKSIPPDWSVCCLVAYGIDFASPEYAELKSVAAAMPYDVELWDKVVPREEYMNKLNDADIIIIGVPIQTALGAIHKGLSFGKKLYLAGSNLETFKQAGAVCFDFADIASIPDEEFFRPLSEDDRKKNADIVAKRTASGDAVELWKDLYEHLLK